MKVVVVSDTHMTRMAKKLPERLIQELRDADAILHAGDWTAFSVLDMLQAYATTEGVAGNNDGDEIIARFGHLKVLDIGGVRIGLVHGHIGTGKREDTVTNAFKSFGPGSVDVIVFGHSHVPVIQKRNEVLMFNPGSPTDKRRQKQYSFGVFTIEEGALVRAEHVFYDDKS
ncbi:metallophosphoesterase family protein [Paenibacillus montanisoli]|uniref:Phosphoesterase n=1 Tax=Paenibacillus montanisoli TaxID=2081970 RepID=A0A328U2A9_9BACL|nr:metallophosphoesterase [Paenibacillus montanisoli]RAP74134.1 YfcE family phosphodiesterase [Paenibacillus montanisoli]